MSTPSAVFDFRPAGIALLATVVIFMMGAWSAAYFRRWPLPADPLDKLTVIANDRVGWTAQAIIFPVAFLATAVIFGVIAARLPGSWPRGLAIGATVLFASGGLLWLPISVSRLQLGAQAAELIRTYDPAAPPPVMVKSTYFWPHTLCVLAGIALMGAALALAGALPTLGWIVAALAIAAAVIGALVWHDWPPFMSYLILLVLAIGLIRAHLPNL
jgi:hypothetical protein